MMRIKEILSQTRRDFRAIFVCEHCGHEKTRDGYDDAYFHQQVTPGMKCDQCGKTAPDSFQPLGTRYSEHEVI